jgi:hypothetical protein
MRAGLLGLDRGRGQSGVGYPQAADRNPRPASPAKLPLVIHTRGGDHKVSTSLGRILCGRGIDTTVGTTEVEACDGKSEADCFALKRQGGRSTPGSTCRSRAAILPASCFWPVVSIAACHRAHGSC